MKNNLIRLIGIFFFIAVTFHMLFSAYKIIITTAPDFSIFYNVGKDIIAGISPYTDRTLFTAFNYPLITGVLFIPLIFFPYYIAQTIFVVLNLLLVPLVVSICLQLLKKKLTIFRFCLITSLIYLSFPFKFTLGMGQVNALAYFLVLLGMLFYIRKRLAIAVILSICGFVVKPVLSFLLLFFLFKKDWKFLFLTMAFFLMTLAFSQLLLDNYTHSFYLQKVPHLLSSQGQDIYYNQGLTGFIARCVQNLPFRTWSFLIIIAFGSVLLYRFLQKSHVKPLLLFSILSTLVVIVDPLSWQHHFIFLIFPFIFTSFTLLPSKETKPLLKVLLFVAYILVSWNIKNPQPLYGFPLSLLLSHSLYGAVLLLGLELYVAYKGSSFSIS